MVQRVFRLWLQVPEAARIAGVPKDGFYRDIRRGTCPFEVKKISGRLHVSARSLGLIPPGESRDGESPTELQIAIATA